MTEPSHATIMERVGGVEYEVKAANMRIDSVQREIVEFKNESAEYRKIQKEKLNAVHEILIREEGQRVAFRKVARVCTWVVAIAAGIVAITKGVSPDWLKK